MKDENLATAPGLSPAEAAVSYLLRRIQADADLRWHMVGTEAFARLCAAEAARTGESADAVHRRHTGMLSGHHPRDARLPKAQTILEKIADLAEEGRRRGGATASVFAEIRALAEEI